MPEIITPPLTIILWFERHPAGESLFWVTLTTLAYWITMVLYRKSRAHPLMLPVVTGTAMVIALLLLTGTAYERYFSAVHPLVFLIGPSTVALAVPLYSQVSRLRAIWWPVTVALTAGCISAIVAVILIVWAFGGNEQILVALAPKAATMPIATSLVAHFDGLVPLAAAAVAVTGIAGTMLSGPVLRLLGPVDDTVHGFALGLSAHAIGTARAFQISETAGAFAAMAMSLNGLLTAILITLMAAFQFPVA